MLKKFEVQGFKNFDYPLVIDFSDVKQYAFNTNCIRDDLLKTIIIYGKNAVGKSNFGLALFDIVTHLVDRNVTPDLYNYYLNNSGDYKNATFKYTFQFDKTEIVYEYKKSDADNLRYEYLEIDNEPYFKFEYLDQNTETIVLNDSGVLIYDALQKMLPNLNYDFSDAGISTLRFIVNNSKMNENNPIIKMYDFVSNMLWFRSLDEHRFIGYKDTVRKANDYYDFIFEGNNLEDFKKLLSIAGVNNNLIAVETPEEKKALYVEDKIRIPFHRTASNGTRALYAYFYWTRNKDVSMLFIDEFDAYYHFELAEIIVKDLEKRNMQTVLTSHNTNLLSNSIMRPDCYFVLTKNKITSIARATDRELREGHNLEKLYMSGEFNEK